MAVFHAFRSATMRTMGLTRGRLGPHYQHLSITRPRFRRGLARFQQRQTERCVEPMPAFDRAHISDAAQDLGEYRTFLRALQVGQVVTLPLEANERARGVVR